MGKLTEQEIEEMLDNEEHILVFRMYTSKGVRMRMKIAKMYCKHYNVLTYIIIQIPLLIVDVIDIVEYIRRKKN